MENHIFVFGNIIDDSRAAVSSLWLLTKSTYNLVWILVLRLSQNLIKSSGMSSPSNFTSVYVLWTFSAKKCAWNLKYVKYVKIRVRFGPPKKKHCYMFRNESYKIGDLLPNQWIFTSTVVVERTYL